MTTQPTLTLTEFLLARIAEDEAVARAATHGKWTAVGTKYPDEDNWHPEEMERGYVDIFDSDDGPIAPADEGDIYGHDAYHIARHDPARILVDCEALRRIVELHTDQDVHECVPTGQVWPSGGWTDEDPWVPCPTLRLLALPYVDHEAFREEWRP